MSEANQAQNPSEIVLGRAARVTVIEEDGRTFHARLQGGGSARVSSSAFVSLEPGDSILLSETQWQQVPDNVWVDERTVGVIRRIKKSGVLLETASGLRFLRKKPKKGLKVSVGSTVEFDDHAGIVKVLSSFPIRTHDMGVEENVVSQYVVPRDEESGLTFASFGGYEDVRSRAVELIETQLDKKAVLDEIGARPVKGIMFTGPPGTGKTHLARIIAYESKATFYLVSGPSIVSKWVGDSEETLRRIFEAAAKEERAIIFFDEIDSIAERRSGDSHEASKRVVAQLLTLLDGFDQRSSNVVVIAATNRIEDVDEALLRPGRFDWEISFGLPTAEDRFEILAVGANRHATTGELPIEELSLFTDGWSAARLGSIWTEASLVAAGDDRKSISGEDLAEALERVMKRPTRQRRREGDTDVA